jgi:hypothetical protein
MIRPDALFVFVMIISGNYLAQLFPCRFQKNLQNNMLLKHFFGFLTLLFFVTLQSPTEQYVLTDAIKNTYILYALFLLLINSHHYTFVFVIVLLSVSYLLTLKIKENNSNTDDGERPVEVHITNNNMEKIQYGIHVTAVVTILMGFLSYMGSKKDEYGKKFDYRTFIFGKTICANNGYKLNYMEGIKNAFY